MVKRRGNVLVMSLLLCALLAVVLVVGLKTAGLRSITDGARLAGLQLEQLHRSAVQDALALLNDEAASVAAGRVLISDEPVSGQTRQVTVTLVERRVVTLRSESRLADGSQRTHHLELLALADAPPFALGDAVPAIYSGGARVSDRWLSAHAKGDAVLASDRALTIGSGAGTVALDASLVVLPLTAPTMTATLASDLAVAGHVSVVGDLHLQQDLSCKEAAIGGTLTIGEGVSLQADTVYLAEDVSADTLARIDAATVYLPHPPDADHAPRDSDYLPLPAPDAAAPPTRYFVLQALN